MPIRGVFWAFWFAGFFLGGRAVYNNSQGFDLIILGSIVWFLVGLLGWDLFGSPINEKQEK